MTHRPDETPLGSRILEYLVARGPSKAIEIAKALGVDKTAVNQVLYGQMKGQVVQDSSYRWSPVSRPSSNPPATKAPPDRDGAPPAGPVHLPSPGPRATAPPALDPALAEPMQQLGRYYLDCLSQEGGDGVSVFADSAFDKRDYFELPALPLEEHAPDDADLDIRQFTSRGRARSQPLTFLLGMPVLVVERQAKSGRPCRKVEPLLLWSLPDDGRWRGEPEGLPSLNPAAVNSLAEGSGPEELHELTVELGLDDLDGEGPDLEGLLLRLHSLRPEWPWLEEPDVARKGPGPLLKDFRGQGILNRAVLVAVEAGGSRYTAGLREELGRLVGQPPGPGCCLGHWMAQALGHEWEAVEQSAKDEPLLEVLPLNLEQREAVRRGLSQPLTVITGPPGTGKSQVVTALLIHAAHQGQRVLFASKNHQAVDVVEARVNALSDAPVLLRLGGSGADRHQQLREYLGRLLSASPGPSERHRYEQTRRSLEEVQGQLSDLAREAEHLVQARNQVDSLEQKAEEARAVFGETRFRRFAEVDIEGLAACLMRLRQVAEAADRSRRRGLLRWFWPLLRGRRLEALNAEIRYLSPMADLGGLLDLPLPEGVTDDRAVADLVEALAPLEERLELARQARAYLLALAELGQARPLEELARQESLLRLSLQGASSAFWDAFMAIRPGLLDREQRRILSDYAAVLAMMADLQAGSSGDRKLWAQYYQLSQKAVGVLSCWAVTSLSARGRIPLTEGMFDLLVIDEASQCDIASALPLLYRARRAVIIGDPQQLRHISTLPRARDRRLQLQAGLQEDWISWSYSVRSLYDLAQSLTGPGDIVMLRDHHRSHPDIIDFSNKEFYEGRLRVATRLDRLELLDPQGPCVRWNHVSGRAIRPPEGGLFNREEAEAVVRELRRLVGERAYPGSLGVVTPFRAQANLIRELVVRDAPLERELIRRGFACDTAHRFQGDERDLMLFSPVLSEGGIDRALSFLANQPHLFNVAITRARAGLLVIGDRHAAERAIDRVKYLGRFARHIERRNPPPPDPFLREPGPEYPPVSNPHEVSDWERVLYRALYQAGLPTMPQYQVEKYRVDLALVRGERRLAIEVDGEAYHRAWDGELLRQDQLRNARLQELGWEVMRFWVYQVRDDLEGCVARVSQWAAKG